jgi:hypothetical protein
MGATTRTTREPPADAPPALKGDGGMDWENVRAVKILRIEDTHD